MFPGFSSRLENEILILNKKNGSIFKTFMFDIDAFNNFNRIFRPFIGATVLAKALVHDDNFWVSKLDWDECGPDIIFKKCNIYPDK